jgi:hypothetical protein
MERYKRANLARISCLEFDYTKSDAVKLLLEQGDFSMKEIWAGDVVIPESSRRTFGTVN